MLLKITSYSDLEPRKLMALYCESNAENADELYPTEEKAAALRKVEASFLHFLENDFFPREKAAYWIWEENGVWLSAARTCETERGLYYLEALETPPQHRNRGYASALLTGILDALKAEGAFRLCDCVSKTNTASLRTHEKCSFAIVSQTGYNYLYKTANEHEFGLEYSYTGD